MVPAAIRSQAGQWQCTAPARAAVPAGERGPPPCRYRRWSRSTWPGRGGCSRCCCRWPGLRPRAAATRRTAAGWWARCRRRSGARWSGPTPPSPTPSSCSGLPCPLHPGEAAGGFWGPPGAAQHSQHLLLPQSSALPAVDVPFREYVEQLLKPQDPAQLGSDTLYFFGDNNFTEWGPLFQQYVPPAFRIPGTSPAYSFGIAGPVLPRPLVARHAQPGHQRLHLHLSGVEQGCPRTCCCHLSCGDNELGRQCRLLSPATQLLVLGPSS
ncbi:jmjC domain-containing protein 8 isoform X4 [Patagioenas fasciata]|uniref:jmjC domain-containing protein 8 isoform X4 n=1 Tax=Patagioenas fasciata TaxID=372321 RepID=UPI003A9A3F14